MEIVPLQYTKYAENWANPGVGIQGKCFMFNLKWLRRDEKIFIEPLWSKKNFVEQIYVCGKTNFTTNTQKPNKTTNI